MEPTANDAVHVSHESKHCGCFVFVPNTKSQRDSNFPNVQNHASCNQRRKPEEPSRRLGRLTTCDARGLPGMPPLDLARRACPTLAATCCTHVLVRGCCALASLRMPVAPRLPLASRACCPSCRCQARRMLTCCWPFIFFFFFLLLLPLRLCQLS